MEALRLCVQSVMTDFPYDWFAAQFEYEMSTSEFSTTLILERLINNSSNPFRPMLDSLKCEVISCQSQYKQYNHCYHMDTKSAPKLSLSTSDTNYIISGQRWLHCPTLR